uniref:Uncharacterized protein n=1 Tax=Ditylenchus dipsaci TaxID=166011 RepID=A0A915DQ80_9BILA
MEIELRHSGEHDEEKSARHVHSEEKSASHEGGSPKLQNGNDREPGAEVLQYGDENSGGDQEAHSTEKNRHDPISTLLELTGDIRAKQIHEGSAWKAQNPGEHKNLTGDDQEAHSTENKTNDPISGVFDPTEHIRARQIHEESAWKAMQNRAQNHGEDEKSMTEKPTSEPISKLDDLTKRIRSEQLQADSAKKFKENAENEAAEKIIESEKAKAAELGGNKKS